jgi:hypothetical protein
VALDAAQAVDEVRALVAVDRPLDVRAVGAAGALHGVAAAVAVLAALRELAVAAVFALLHLETPRVAALADLLLQAGVLVQEGALVEGDGGGARRHVGGLSRRWRRDVDV